MKKVLFLIAALIVSFSASAQKNFVASILIDEVKDGYRHISTSGCNIREGLKDRHPIRVYLSRFERLEDGKHTYSFSVHLNDTRPFSIPEGGLLLIRTRDGGTIELEQKFPADLTEDRVGKYDSFAKVRLFNNKGSYDITEDELQQIIDHGVEKIRIEVNLPEHVNTTYTKERWQAPIESMLRELRYAVSKKEKTDIRSDF